MDKPVAQAHLAGIHIADGVTAEVKRTPSLASLSRFGVLTHGFPAQLNASNRC